MVLFQLSAKADTETVKLFVRNLKSLMHRRGIDNPKQLSAFTGVSERHCYNIMAQDRAPSLEILERIAEAFSVTVWQLLIPQLDAEVDSGELATLVDGYLHSTKQAQQYIQGIVAYEAGKPQGTEESSSQSKSRVTLLHDQTRR